MDVNEDGLNDILSGSYSRSGQGGMAGLFQVLYGTKDGNFQKAEALNGTDDEPLIIPIAGRDEQTKNICTRPTAVDWDGDGDLDLVVGNFEGTFFLFHGEGKGKFAPQPEQMKIANGTPLLLQQAHSDPAIVDWDGDGDLDIVSGSAQGGAFWSENTAEADSAPVLTEFRELIPAAGYGKGDEMKKIEDLKSCGAGTRVWVADIDTDGQLDLLVGDNVTLTAPAEGLSMEEFQEKKDTWQKEFNAASQAMQKFTWDGDEKPTQEMIDTRKKFNLLYHSRSKFIDEELTGFVWLYRRK